ncbi:MAG: phosphatase PAP2 family protein [Thermaurantimonas sp.]
MTKAYKIPRPFFLLFLVFFATTLFLSIFYDKIDLHLIINQWRHPWADVFFKYFTHLGDGVLFVPAIIYFSVQKDTEKVILFILIAVLTLSVTALGKSVLFPDINRPVLAIGADKLNLVEGVRMHSKFSFPSGHTMAAFAYWSAMAAVAHGSFAGLFALIAVLVGISRVYLSQHFVPDVAAGSVLGIMITEICFRLHSLFLTKK